MSETLIPQNDVNRESRAYKLMANRLGDSGLQLLDQQLSRWHELNSKELHSPLRDSLKSGNTILPKGTLIHSAGRQPDMHALLLGIAEKGIVSGELIGVVEDAETHGCADFFKVPVDAPVSGYLQYAGESIIEGKLKSPRSERMVLSGISFIVDPNTEGIGELLTHDGYTDANMQPFVRPPSGRTNEDTAAILGGVPRGAIAGAIVDRRLAERTDVLQNLIELFPGLPVLDHEGSTYNLDLSEE